MNISTEKLNIIQQVLEIQDADFLELVKNIIDFPTNSRKDWWSQISDPEKASIERGIDDLNEKRISPHHDVRKKYEK